MFGIPGKQAVTLTPKAVAQVRKLMEAKGHAGLRIGVKKGGCAGMEYTMDYVDAADPHDEVVDQDGAIVMIAPMAQMFLFGTEIDYRQRCSKQGSSSTIRMWKMRAAVASRSSSRMSRSLPPNTRTAHPISRPDQSRSRLTRGCILWAAG